MKDLLNSMSMEEYFGRILKLPLYETRQKYNYDKPLNNPKKGLDTSRKLSRYREFVNRRKEIQTKIREETDFLIEADKRTDGESLISRNNGLVDLYIQLSIVSLRIKACEEIRDKISDPFVKQAVVYRYFTDTARKIPSWSETAKAVGIPLNGCELRAWVNSYLARL